MVEKIKQALERAYLERRRSPGHGLDAAIEYISSQSKASVAEILENAETRQINKKRLALNRIITFDNSDISVESYRLLRTQIISRMKTDGLTTIGITSPNADEGKTVTSVNLAISMANTADIDVVLIDGDITHPSINESLGISTKHGLVDLLDDKVELSELILKLSIPNLWLIPGRHKDVSLLDHTSTNRIEDVIDSLTFSDRNLVIVDLPPVLSKDDTLAIAACLDGIILVVKEGATKSNEVVRAVDLLKQGNLIGTVLNKYSRHQMTYY